MRYIDAHCHIHFDSYESSRKEVLSRMEESDTGGILVGVDHASSASAANLAGTEGRLWATVGLHPCYVKDEQYDENAYAELLKLPYVVGVGECGLDYYREEDPLVHQKQKDVFVAQLRLAAEHDMPLMIHARPSKGTVDAYQDLIDIVQEYKQEYGKRLRGNVHFFVGGVAEMKALNSLDFTVSVTGVITFASDYDEVVRETPRDMLLVETDAPYATPVPHRGKTNEPIYVEHVVRRVAEIWGISDEKAAQQLMSNAHRVFGLEK